MKEELINELETAQEKVQMDECVKRIIAQRCVLARILQETADEFKSYPVEEIMDMIEPNVEISIVPVRPGQKSKKLKGRIIGDNTEDKVPGEGVNYYDIRFHVYLPKKQKRVGIKLLINIEAQRRFYQKYHFVTRGIFYGARMISAQLGTEFTGSRYDKIKKVYSIWICMNAPKKIGNSMAEFSIQKKNIIGRINDGRKHYDKLSVIIICLNENAEQKRKGLHQFLNILLSEKISVEEKQARLEADFDMNFSEELRKGVNDMCNFGDVIEERGIRKGKKLGKREGKQQTNLLNQYLIRDGRLSDLIKATTDPDFQNQLFQEYGFQAG